jgi:hypothetical protein
LNLLWEKDLISKETVQGLIPGINPYDENKLIEKEKAKQPIENDIFNNIIEKEEKTNGATGNNIESKQGDKFARTNPKQ